MSALRDLAGQLRDEGTPVSPHVVDPAEAQAFAADAGEHAFTIEAVREGYLLHYGKPRLLSGHDEDLALLTGDYLYALGIEGLAAMGDTKAVLALADLISTSAQLHTEGRENQAPALWSETISAITTSA